MNCKKIRNLLMTDYADGELKPALSGRIKEHLQNCAACKAFQEALEQKAVSPFKNAQEFSPPASVWTKIQDTIDRQKEPQEQFDLWEWVKEKFNSLFAFPRPAYALAAIIAVFLTVILVANTPSLKQTAQIEKFFAEQDDFISSLDSEIEYNGFGETLDDISI